MAPHLLWGASGLDGKQDISIPMKHQKGVDENCVRYVVCYINESKNRFSSLNKFN